MAQKAALLCFLAGLIACLITGLSILYALVFGLVCFCAYAKSQGSTGRQILFMLWSGIKNLRIILVVFLLIGMLTAAWRASGTIPFILYHSLDAVNIRFFPFFTFLLCALLSVLTGTSFGTAGTMGVICMMIARSLGINPLICGGAVLSGIFVGDRCSPMSSSALLVSELTKTNIYHNIVLMAKSAAVPFGITCLFYLLLPAGGAGEGAVSAVAVFREHFKLSAVTVLPAALLILLACFRVRVIINMAVSVLCAAFVAFFVQKMPAGEIFTNLMCGYSAGENAALAVLINGGGVVSMLRVSAIVLISSSYFGIFKETPLLDGVHTGIKKLAGRITPCGAVTVTAVLTSMISCNQTLATMLTYQMGKEVVQDGAPMMLQLENTVILMAALIPWSIAGAVPIVTIGAETPCLLFAAYLYLVPLWNFMENLWREKKKKHAF